MSNSELRFADEPQVGGRQGEFQDEGEGIDGIVCGERNGYCDARAVLRDEGATLRGKGST